MADVSLAGSGGTVTMAAASNCCVFCCILFFALAIMEFLFLLDEDIEV